MRKRTRKKSLGFITKAILVFNFLFAGLLLTTYLASFVDPATFWPIAFLGLAYPWLLLINVLFVVFWIFKKAPFALISLTTILLGWKFLVSSIGFRESTSINVPKSSENFIRVMTYNVHHFKKFNYDNDKLVKDHMLEVIRREQPDVICLQEFFTRKKGEYDQTKALKKILQTDHYYFEPSMGNDYESHGLAIFSKFPIKNKGKVVFTNTSHGNSAIYTDVLSNKRLFRVYNVHLQSISFQPEDYDYLKRVKDDLTDVESTKRIGSRLKNAFIKRSEQAKQLKSETEMVKLPYIIAGDFNDTPASFAVNTVSSGLLNSFREKGSGFGITYNGDFPNFQIDYILSTAHFDVRSYTIIDKKISDHYAVRADLELKNQ